MKMKFEPQYVLSLGASAVLVYVLLLVPSYAHAQNVNFSTQHQIALTLGNATVNLVVVAGSAADAVTVNAGSVSITLSTGQTFTFRDFRSMNFTSTTGTKTCPSGYSQIVFNSAGTHTVTPTNEQCGVGGGGSPSSAPSAPSTPAPQAQKPAETVKKPTDTTQQPKVEQSAEEKPVAGVGKTVGEVKKELNALKAELNKNKKTRNKKIAVAGNEKFALLVTDLNRGLAAANVEGELKEDLVAKPNDVLTLAKRLESLVNAQAVLARAEEKVENPEAVVTAAEDALRAKLQAFFADGKLVKKEVSAVKKLLKSAKIKVKGGISIKNQERVFSSAESGLAEQHAAQVKAATKNAPKELKKAQATVTKLQKDIQSRLNRLNK